METKNIKEGWRQVKLGDIVKWTTGKLDSNAMIENGIYPYFTCSQETFRINEYAFDQEAVLLGGNNAAGIFPLKYYKGKFNAYQRTYVMSAIDNEVLDNKYLYYALIPQLISFKNMSTGATTKFLTKGILDNFEIKLPLLQIQKYIAGFLSNYDNLIENNSRRIQILEQTAKEIYKEWFVNFRFPGHETIKMIDSGSDFGEIPEGWKVEILGEQVNLIKGVSYKSSELSDDQGVDFINLKCFNRGGGFRIDGLKKYTGKYKESQDIKVGDIVMAVTDMTQNREVVARVALVPRTKEINQFTLSCDVIKIDPIGIGKDYLYFVLRFSEFSSIYKARANGANVLHLRPDEIKDFSFLLPTPEVLEKFIEIISNITQEIDVLNIKIDNLKKTRDLLLPRLISGEIDVLGLEII